jgi:hypothetical protein
MEPLNGIDRVMRSGPVVWACLLTLLVLVGAILSSTFGLNSGVMIFLVVSAVIMGLSGLFMLKRFSG